MRWCARFHTDAFTLRYFRARVAALLRTALLQCGDVLTGARERRAYCLVIMRAVLLLREQADMSAS